MKAIPDCFHHFKKKKSNESNSCWDRDRFRPVQNSNNQYTYSCIYILKLNLMTNFIFSQEIYLQMIFRMNSNNCSRKHDKICNTNIPPTWQCCQTREFLVPSVLESMYNYLCRVFCPMNCFSTSIPWDWFNVFHSTKIWWIAISQTTIHPNWVSLMLYKHFQAVMASLSL